MTLELINGQASEAANSDAGEFFAGTIAPRRYHVAESLMDRSQDLLERAFSRRISQETFLSEAFSTSDFTLGVFAAVDTQVMAQYDELPSTWRQYTDVTTVNDFRPTRLLDRWNDTFGLKQVPELMEYPSAAGGDHQVYWINVAKYGLRDAFSWEASINNSIIGEIQDAPGKYARAARETETINALSNLLKVDPKTGTADGVNTDFFKTANGNAPDTRALTAANLDAVLEELLTRKPRGRLAVAPDFIVVIPRALEPQMKRIMALREIRRTVGDTTEVFDNYLGSVDYVVDPALDVINTNAKAKGTWFVLPKPGSRRPASFAAFLRGYEAPDMRYKADTGARFGGGLISPMEGSFGVDDIQTRVRHVLGRQNGDSTFTYASTGS